MLVDGKNFLIFGIKRSGVAVAKLIAQQGGKIYFCDDHMELEDKNYMQNLGGVDISQQFSQMLNIIDCMILSPSVPIDTEKVKQAVRLDIPVIGELGCAAKFSNKPIIATTGTNGKSTTVSLITHILNSCGKTTVSCGNIGLPLSDVITSGKEYDYLSVEVSSYQMETADGFCPSVGVFLNLTPDHLARHKTMDNYFAMKKRMFENMAAASIKIINRDDPRGLELAQSLDGKIYFFSCRQEVVGTYIDSGNIIFSQNGQYQKIMRVSEIPLLGSHNVLNVLAAVATCQAVGVEHSDIRRGVMGFTALKHRLQKIGEICGKQFINDSKATNINSTLCAVGAMSGPTVLILGGSTKGEDFAELFSGLSKCIMHCVLTGDTRYELLDGALRAGYNNISICDDFDEAVHRAYLRCINGGNVLLSPACASFDKFKNFEHRGDHFIELVRQYAESK